MATSARSSRSIPNRKKRTPGSSQPLRAQSQSSSWGAIGTMLFGLLVSYWGCVPPKTSDWIASEQQFPVDHDGASRSTHLPHHEQSLRESSSELHQASWMERDAIIIGSFNIQSFGRTKMNRPEIVTVLVDIARRFDILAIQELRDSQEGTIPQLLSLINSDGGQYRAAVSPRINYGMGNNSEQLLFLYDSMQIELIDTPYVAQDLRQAMYRPPYVAHFRYRSRYPQEAFSFVLMNVHTSPDHKVKEMSALEEMISNVMRNHPAEDDFILLGDLNEEPGRFLSYRWMNNQYAAILSHWKTNTAETKNYDNIVFDHRRTAEFTGEAGVLNLKTYYQLTREQADRVSDHMPVWALFSSREVVPGEITQQPAMIR